MINEEWDELNAQEVPFWMAIDNRSGSATSLILYCKKEKLMVDAFKLYKRVELFYDGREWTCVVYATYDSQASTTNMFKEDEWTSGAEYMKIIDPRISHNIIKIIFEKDYERIGRFKGVFE